MPAAYNRPMRVSPTPSWQADNPDPNNRKDWQEVSNGTGMTIQRPLRSLSRKAKQRIIGQQMTHPITVVSGQDDYHLGQSGKMGGHAGYGK